MRKANKAARTAFTSRRYRELMQNNSFECYKHLDSSPQSDVAICPHHHAFYEIIFVVQGDLFYEVEGRSYHLKRGDVILIDELQFHHGLIHHRQNYERYALWIHPKYMQLLSRRFPKLDPQYCFLQLNSDNNNVVHLDQQSFTELERDLSHLFTSYWSKTPSDEVLSESYFAIILTKLNQIVHRQHCAQLHAAAAAAAAVAGAHAPVNRPDGTISTCQNTTEEKESVSADGESHELTPAARGFNSMGSSTVFFNNSRTASHTVKLENVDSSSIELAGSATITGPLAEALAGANNFNNLPIPAMRDIPGTSGAGSAGAAGADAASTGAADAATAISASENSAGAAISTSGAEGSAGSKEGTTGTPVLAPTSSLYEIVTLLHDPRNANDVFNADPKLSNENWELDWEYANGRYSAHYVDVTGQNAMQSGDGTIPVFALESDGLSASQNAAIAAAVEAAAAAAEKGSLAQNGKEIQAAINSAQPGYSVISSQLSTHQTPLDDSNLQDTSTSTEESSDLTQFAEESAISDDNEANKIALEAQDDGSKPAPMVTRSDKSQFNYHLDDDMHLNLNLSERLKLSALLKYINLHINDNLSLDELSQRFSLSKFYLTRRFKELTGLSLHQFIVKKRLTKARYLISVGVDPYRAAVDAGFNNYSHFSRTFKSYFGQNPSSIPQAHTIHHRN